MKYVALKYMLKSSPFGGPVEHNQIVQESHLKTLLITLKSPVIGATDIQVSTPFSFLPLN